MEYLSSLAADLSLGLSVAGTPTNITYCILGVVLGMLVGVLPGIGALTALSLLFPVTYHLEPVTAIIMLGGIYYGTAYGGSIASILLNIPGTPASAVVCLDGYPMAKQGRAGVSLFMTAVASFFGGSVGIVIMMLFSASISRVAIAFNAPEYFSLMVLGLVAGAMVSGGSALKALASVVLGVLFGLVGMDIYSGEYRMSFGLTSLSDGISIAAFTMGLFGVCEVMLSIRTTRDGSVHKVTLRSLIPTRDDVRRSVPAAIRGTAVGAFFGMLPGVGAAIVAFLSYALERRVAKDPSRFGKGAIEGVVGPEASNNAADQTSFIPTLTLGIPGSGTMAIILAVLIVHGVSPGPRLITDHPDLFWGLIVSFWLGNLILLLLNIPLVGLWVQLLRIPYRFLYPAILVFLCLGVYSIDGSLADVWMITIIGIIALLIRYLSLPVAPMLLAFVLGPMLEDNFRRAMIVSRGDFWVFFERPISAGALVVSLVLLCWGVMSVLRGNRKARLLYS